MRRFPPKKTNFISALCRGDSRFLLDWMEHRPRQMIVFSLLTIVCGFACYGFSMGIWKSGEMAMYVALKLPLLIFVVFVLNSLLNGLLAQVWGSGLEVGQSMQFLLMGFVIMALILGALSPLVFWMSLQVSASPQEAENAHAIVMVSHVLLMAYAGIVAHACLFYVLLSCVKNKAATRATFFSWLAGNLFVGAQVSWVLRPFFCSPSLAVDFLREDPLQGTFYEAIWRSLQILFS